MNRSISKRNQHIKVITARGTGTGSASFPRHYLNDDRILNNVDEKDKIDDEKTP